MTTEYVTLKLGETLALTPEEIENSDAIERSRKAAEMELWRRYEEAYRKWHQGVRESRRIHPDCRLVFNGKEMVCMNVEMVQKLIDLRNGYIQ